KNDPAVDNQIKAQIQDHISNIFAYCIYSDEKFDTITADDKATLNSQVAALLDGAADTIVPELISDYFKVLTKQSVVKDYTNVTVDDTYIGTPDQLHFEITQQKLANSSFKPSSNNKNEENMKKNLATTNGLFDVEFVFQ
ncbi:TPA: hypothetical protein DCW54_03525, partial [Candidatus Dependentiae bacterium]|nr:hypothetical protein [Candidatus Dependentiae bacterium]